jgi:NADPH:quinone reductase-like Zn-dependent oxidoreductase
MAREGKYLLQPIPGFVPGYEVVGEVVDLGQRAARNGVQPGAVVAVCLPRMAGYTDYLTVSSWQAVELPAGLDPVLAAAVPLDYLTALSILDRHARLRSGDSALIQGASGGVGTALAELGAARGLTLYGTASRASENRVRALGVEFIDYAEPLGPQLRGHEPGGVKAVFNHLTGPSLRECFDLLAPGGVLVNYAFSGRGGGRLGMITGSARVAFLGLTPAKRTALCALPTEVATHHEWYRGALGGLLSQVASGTLHPIVSETFPLSAAVAAHRAFETKRPGKIVLVAA